MQSIHPCLWFDHQAEEAAKFYVSIFKNSKIVKTTCFLDGSLRPAGSVMTVTFMLDGQEFLALNGGPAFIFTPALSLVAKCETQAEVDHLWAMLSEGGEEGQGGWVKDKYGVSWQVVPNTLFALLGTNKSAAVQRTFAAVLHMKKIDIATLERAYKNA